MWRRFLEWLLDWVLNRLNQECYIVPSGFKAWVAMAQNLCQEVEEKNPAKGFGESKRHQVYAQLQKDLPEVAKRHIGLAIEVALNRRKV